MNTPIMRPPLVSLKDYEVLRGNLSLAEEGLANATQESASLTIQRDHWLEIARQKDSLIDTQDAAQTSLHAENIRLRDCWSEALANVTARNQKIEQLKYEERRARHLQQYPHGRKREVYR